MNRQHLFWIRAAGIGLGEILLLIAIGIGIRHETEAVNFKVNEISDLRDPSPFRAALLGHLGKIHLAIQGYLHNPDPALKKQMDESRTDFEALLPDFVKQNPKLFPQTAAEEIRRTFGIFNEAVGRTLEANTHRMESRSVLERNFTQMLFLIDHNLRPLIRKDQADGEERREAVLNIENQALAWHENLLKAWTQSTDVFKAIAYENDNRGQTYLELYSRMELLPRERKAQREIRTLWLSNSDLARESHVKENLVNQAEKEMEGEREQVIMTFNRYLPAMPPAELVAKKEALLRSMHLHMSAGFGIGLLGLASVVTVAILGFRFLNTAARARYAPVSDGIFRPSPSQAKSPATTLQMDLKGVIMEWSSAAEALYGYTSAEMRGQSIGKLFESESEISRLVHELEAAKQAIFETIHKTKAGATIPVRIEFCPLKGSIGLVCTRRE